MTGGTDIKRNKSKPLVDAAGNGGKDWRSKMVVASKKSIGAIEGVDEVVDLETRMRLNRQFQVAKLIAMEDEDVRDNSQFAQEYSENDDVSDDSSTSDDEDSEECPDDDIRPEIKEALNRRSDRMSQRNSLSSNEALVQLKNQLEMVERKLQVSQSMNKSDVESYINFEVARRVALKEREWEEKESKMKARIAALEASRESETNSFSRSSKGHSETDQSTAADRSSAIAAFTNKFKKNFRKGGSSPQKRGVDDNGNRNSDSTATTVSLETDLHDLHIQASSKSLLLSDSEVELEKEYKSKIETMEAQLQEHQQNFETASKLIMKALRYQQAMDLWVHAAQQRLQEVEEDKRRALYRLSEVVEQNEKMIAIQYNSYARRSALDEVRNTSLYEEYTRTPPRSTRRKYVRSDSIFSPRSREIREEQAKVLMQSSTRSKKSFDALS